MTSYGSQTYRNYTFQVTGSTSGSVWGSLIYTHDSRIGRAAIHAGRVSVGQTAVLTIMMLPGQSSYASTTQNGITTSSYGSWSASYSFV